MRNSLVFFLLICGASPMQAATVSLTVLDAAGRPRANAIVSLKPSSFAGGPQFAFPKAIAQRDIRFEPAVAIVPVGTKIAFPNFDRVRHHVYSFSRAKKFELKLYGQDQTRSVVFDQPGTVALGCNIHDQMNGIIRVVDAPFAGVTDTTGRLSLQNVPTGAAQLVVWHARARARENEVKGTLLVRPGGTAQTIRLQVG